MVTLLATQLMNLAFVYPMRHAGLLAIARAPLNARLPQTAPALASMPRPLGGFSVGSARL